MYKGTFCYFFHVGAKPPPKCFIKPNFGYFTHYSTKIVVLAQIDIHLFAPIPPELGYIKKMHFYSQ